MFQSTGSVYLLYLTAFNAFFNKDFKYLPLFCRLNQAGWGFETNDFELIPGLYRLTLNK